MILALILKTILTENGGIGAEFDAAVAIRRYDVVSFLQNQYDDTDADAE